MKLVEGMIIKINGEIHEIIAIHPHQDIKDVFYYELDNGMVERDCRLHPQAVWIKIPQ